MLQQTRVEIVTRSGAATVQGAGCRVQGAGCRVQGGAGCREARAVSSRIAAYTGEVRACAFDSGPGALGGILHARPCL